LVSEVNACLKHLAHADDCHDYLLSCGYETCDPALSRPQGGTHVFDFLHCTAIYGPCECIGSKTALGLSPLGFFAMTAHVSGFRY